MSELFVYSAIMLVSILISAVSQIMLKKSAQKTYPSKLKEYLNPIVITAYILFFGCSFITMYALKVVPLSMYSIIESCGYIFVAVLSFFFLKEKLTKRQLAGMALIIIGIAIYSIEI
ncbi:MAG: EamA family transporter [Oscillospiraceae bacterium]|nr:EamA family transporter [Oscillospiraceae bacterium]